MVAVAANSGQAAEHVDAAAVDVDVHQGHPDAFSRLVALPPGVLWHIVRKMGPRSRIVSKGLMHAYGPLDCGLKSWKPSAPAQLRQLLISGSAERLRHATSLQLGDGNNHPVNCEDWHGFFRLIAHALPSLSSLEIATRQSVTSLVQLAPLAPTLTRLCVSPTPLGIDPDSLHSLQQLTNVRSLTLGGGSALPGDPQVVLALQQALGALPHLTHLAWVAAPWSPQFLSDLAPHMPQLTSISLGALQDTADAWDDRTTAAVKRSLPHLHTLSFQPNASRLHGQTDAKLEAMLAGLAQCSSIKAIHMTRTLTGGKILHTWGSWQCSR